MHQRDFIFYYYNLVQFSPMIPLIIGLVRYRRIEQALRVFLIYAAVSLSLTIVMLALSVRGMNNHWVSNLAPPLYVIPIIFTFSLWQTNTTTRIVLKLSIIAFILIWLVEILNMARLDQFTVVSRPLEGMLFVIIACLMLYRLSHDTEHPILDQPQFWISSGLVIYYAGMIPINLLTNTLSRLSDKTFRDAIIISQPTLALIANLIYTMSFRCPYPHRQSSSGLSS